MALLKGYIAKWENYPPDEIKIKVEEPGILAPALEILKDWKHGPTWDEYTERYIKQIKSNEKAMHKLETISKLSKNENVRMVFFEKNAPYQFILMDLIKKMQNPEKRVSKSFKPHKIIISALNVDSEGDYKGLLNLIKEEIKEKSGKYSSLWLTFPEELLVYEHETIIKLLEDIKEIYGENYDDISVALLEFPSDVPLTLEELKMLFYV